MVFSSLTFLCVFLPLTFVLYVALRSTTARNWLLIAASLIFYAYGEPVYILLMLASTVLNWLFGRGMSRAEGTARKALVTLAVVVNLSMIGVFKYADMFVGTLNAIPGVDLPLPGIALPLGISFFTFQALSYVIDVYRGDVSGEDGYPKVLLFISFFPQIIAGPIIKYHDIEAQIDSRRLELPEVARGLRRFCYGMGKKVLISNAMASCVDALFALDPSLLNAGSAWLGAIAYLLQIYFDFSGYSDMAIGLGHMFGFKIMENFDYPYASTSIKEFWRRWHISLSTWFKEYLYIPLGGNRKGRARTVLNKWAVFVLCGLWHGASWTFVVWGVIHGAFSMLEEVVPKLRKLPKPVGHLYTLLVVTLAFVVFRADTLSQAGSFIAAMFTGFTFGGQSVVELMRQLTPSFVLAFVCGAVFAQPVKLAVAKKVGSTPLEKPVEVLSYIAAFALLALCLVQLAGGGYNPFIYFRF